MRAKFSILALALLVAASAAYAGGQGGAGSDGNSPAFLNKGDAKSKGAYAGPVIIELRDDPPPISIPLTARVLRATARISDGVEARLISVDWQCGEPAPADPCNGGSEIQVSETAAIQAVAAAIVIPEIVTAFGLDPATTMELVKLKQYVQDGPYLDADGIFSYYAAMDVGLDSK